MKKRIAKIIGLVATTGLMGLNINHVAWAYELFEDKLSSPEQITAYEGYSVAIDGGYSFNNRGGGFSNFQMGITDRTNIDKYTKEIYNTNDLDAWQTVGSFQKTSLDKDNDDYKMKLNSSYSGLNQISNSNNIYAHGYDSKDKEQYDSFEYVVKLNGIKAEASNKWFLTGIYGKEMDYGKACVTETQTYVFDVKKEPYKIYPNQYDNETVLSPDEIREICPWIDSYKAEVRTKEEYNSDTKKYEIVVYSKKYDLSSKDAEYIFNQYKGTKYFQKDWVNAKAGRTVLKRNITSWSDLVHFANYENYAVYEIKLPDNTDNLKVQSAETYYLAKYGTQYTNHYFERDTSMQTTWQISKYKDKNFQNLAQTEDFLELHTFGQLYENIANWFSYDAYREEFAFETSKYMRDSNGYYFKYEYIKKPASLNGEKSFYVRRISSAPSVLSIFNNAVSPAKRIGPTLSLDKLTVTWDGDAVVEGTNIDPQYVKITAEYSDGTQIYKGNGNYIKFYGTKIFNMGNHNFVNYIYTDPRTGDVITGSFQVPGKQKTPVKMVASYLGDVVVEKTSFALQDVRITVTYNNGDIGNYPGTSLLTGVESSDFYGRGDLDGNSVLNTYDLTLLNAFLKDQSTMSATQRTQADVNGDGKIDGKDATKLTEVLDRKVPLGGKIFYASFAKLYNSNGRIQFAPFRVEAKQKTPYKMIITESPKKTTYIEGENFDPTGMIVTIYYNNGEYKNITFDGTEDRTGLSIGDADHPTTKLSTKQTTIPITYSENGETLSVNQRINVKEMTLTSIKITKAPDALVYAAGENFKPAGMEVKAFFDEGEDGHVPTSMVLATAEYTLTNNKRLNDAREYVVIKADKVDSSNSDTNGYVRIKKSLITSGQTDFSVGVKGTFTYTKAGSTSAKITGTIVGNHLVKVTYTSRGITKSDYQPITVNQKMMTGLKVEQMPYKVNYMTGQSFDAAGLILRASFTDGSSEFVYANNADRAGYIIIDPDNLQASRIKVVAEFTDNGVTKQVEVPITVEDPTIASITATYVGTNIFVGNSFKPHDVTIIVNYTDGSASSFRADEANADGTFKVKIVTANSDGSVDVTRNQDTKVYVEGENTYGAIYAGKTATFTVNGIANPKQLDFSTSTAKSKRKYSQWTEDFTAIKIRTVADYINGEVTGLPIETVNQDENHLSTDPTTTDTRTHLTYDEGIGKGIATGETTKSPMLYFLREGSWRQPETVISIEYKARTMGYLFPETVNAKFDKDGSYIEKYSQDRDNLKATDQDGWSDWVSDSDSTGTVVGHRVAWNFDDTDTDESEAMVIDRLKLRLKDVPAGSNAKINVEVEDTKGVHHTYNGIDENTTIKDPARIKISLAGNVQVINNESKKETKAFGDVYEIYYRASVDDAQKWVKSGEWAGVSGVPIESIEIRVLLKENTFDMGSTTDSPIISEHPKNTTARIGEKTVLQVSAVGQALSYQWYKNDAVIVGATQATYQTPTLTAADNGSRYYCVVTNDKGRETKTVTITLSVKDSYPIITENIKDIEADVGSVVTVHVTATCKNPADLKYEWQMTNAKNEWEPMAGGNKEQISFTLTAAMHGRKIRCKISNSEGYVNSYVAGINAKSAPIVTLNTPSDFIITSRGTATFTASVVTHGAGSVASFAWYVDNVLQTETSEKFVWMPKESGTHNVKVVVKDVYGETTAEKTIYVGSAPKVTLSGEQTVSGKTATVKVKANVTSDDAKNVKYEWRVDGSLLTGQEGSQITLSNLSVGDQKVVMCVIKDNFGTATASFTVTVKGK